MRTGRWWMLGVTCLSVIVVNLDLTILNIALPDISGALHAGTGDLQWLVDAYSLVFAGVMLPAGMAGDRLGRKRLLLAGLAVFLAASLWCALSVSAGELIAARALMGLGAGIVFPLSLAVVSVAFGDDDRPTAIGILTAGVALALPFGPVLGGLLLQHFSWHAVFWINVPAACLALAAGAVLMPESRNPAAPPLDALGAMLPAGAVTCLVWGVINGPEHGWTALSTVLLLAGAAVLLAAFLAREHRSANPVIDPALFGDQRFTWGTAATIAVSVALYAILFVFPQYLQSVLGDDPASAGLRLLPMMGGLLVAGGAAWRCRARGGHQARCRRRPRCPGRGTRRAEPGPPDHGLCRRSGRAGIVRARRGSVHRCRDGRGDGRRRRRRGRDRRLGEQRTAQYRRGDHRRRSRQRAVRRRRPRPRPRSRRPARPRGRVVLRRGRRHRRKAGGDGASASSSSGPIRQPTWRRWPQPVISQAHGSSPGDAIIFGGSCQGRSGSGSRTNATACRTRSPQAPSSARPWPS